MDWTTLIATLVGALIATVTALLSEGRRHRREAETEWLRTRRELYAMLLAALAKSRSDLLALSKRAAEGLSLEELYERARLAFAPCYELRHQLELIAPREVVAPTVEYFRAVRELRNLVGQGVRATDDEWRTCMGQVKNTLEEANKVLREDLGADGNSPPRLGRS